MTDSHFLPHGESLRRAIQWISDHEKYDQQAIEQASVQFDLTPQEEAFLQRHFKVEPARKSDQDET